MRWSVTGRFVEAKRSTLAEDEPKRLCRAGKGRGFQEDVKTGVGSVTPSMRSGSRQKWSGSGRAGISWLVRESRPLSPSAAMMIDHPLGFHVSESMAKPQVIKTK
jgi:hypothetical protein